MNNIQKAFKTKARMGLRMATGGVVPNSFSQEAGDNGPAQVPSVGNNMDFTNKMKLQLADLQRENAMPGGVGSSRVVNGVAMDGSADAAAAYEKTLQPQAQAQTSAAPGTSPVSNPLATAKAFSGLSMLDQRNLTNPGNQPYGIDGQPVKQGRTFVTPGSAAEASMRDGQISALGNLRAGLRMADGGVVPKETPEQVMARMNAKFGLGGTPAPTPAPAPAPAPSPTPAPSQPTATQGGLLGKTTDAIRNRAEELRKAANYEKGGIVHGPGTRTSDSVPVHLSRGEAVLPGKTVDALGGPDAVEQMIESTNGKPPVRAGLRVGGSYADGTVNNQARVLAQKLWETHPNISPVSAPSAAEVAAQQQAGIRAAGSRTAQALRAAENARGSAAALDVAQTARSAPMAPPSPAAPSSVVSQAFKEGAGKAGGWGSAKVGEGLGKAIVSAAPYAVKAINNPVTRTVVKSVPYVAGAIDATDVADVVTDPNKDWVDVSHEVANKAGRWATAGLGSVAGAKAGAGLGAAASLAFPPAAPILVGAGGVLGGAFGGIAGYMGADKLMREAGGAPPSESANGITSGFKRNIMDRVSGKAPAAEVTPATTPVVEAPVPAAAAPVQPANPAADIQSRSTDAEALRGFAQRSMNLPQTGTVVDRGNAGLRSIRDNAGVMNTLNEANSQQGTGISYSKTKGADGKDQLLISAGPTTKDQYLGADGKPTNDWTKTAQYQQAIAQNAQDKARLKELQWDNAVSSANSPNAGYRAEGLRTAQMMLAKDQIDQHGQMTPMQQAQLALQAAQLKATIDNRNIDNLRAAQQFKAGEDRSNRTEEREQFKDAATGADGKLNGESLALLNRAAAAYNDDPNLNAPQNSQAKITQAKTIQHTNDIGQHWFTPEKAQDGYTVPDWTMRQTNGLGDALRGYFTGNVYEDPITGQVISEREVARMPPDVQEGFFRQMELKKKAREAAARRTAPTK